MQVKVTRNHSQATGLLGGKKPISYTSTVRIELSADENAKVEKHGMGKIDLFDVYIYNQNHKPLELAGSPLLVKVENLLKGFTFESKSLSDVFIAQNQTLDGCRSFKKYLEITDTFNGTEMVIDLEKPNEEILVAR